MAHDELSTSSGEAEFSDAPKRARARPVTQKQIAERVGVTQQAVALALQGNTRVGEAMRDKILAVAKELGYSSHANRPARAMAAARHGTRVKNDIIAIIFDVPPHVPTITAPYFMLMVDGVELEAADRKIDLFLIHRKTTVLPWLIKEGLVDGVILLGSHRPALEIAELDIPVVTLGTHSRGISGVSPREAQGTRLTTQHLLELGHTRIAYLGPHLNWRSAHMRLEGYQNALLEAGISPDASLVETTVDEPLEPYARESMQNLMDRADFTALVCHNDPVAMGAVRVAQERGLRVPHDMSITGFDDVSIVAGFSPAITSVSFPSVAMGRAAVRMLLEDTSQIRQEEFAVELQVRDTTAKPPPIETHNHYR